MKTKIHGSVRGSSIQSSRRHTMWDFRRIGSRRVGRGRARDYHRPDAAHAGRARRRDPPLPGDDRQAVRRQPHLPAGGDLARLSRIHPRDHRGRRQDRRDGGQQPSEMAARPQGSRHQGHPHRKSGASFAPKAESIGCDAVSVDELRMRRPPRRRRRAELHPAAAGGGGTDDSFRRIGRHGRWTIARRRAGARRGRDQHGHALHRDEGGARARSRQAGPPRHRTRHRLSSMRPLRNTERVLKNAAVDRLLEKERTLGSE